MGRNGRRWWRAGPEFELPIRGPLSDCNLYVRAVGQITQQQVARAFWTWDETGTEFKEPFFFFWTLSYFTLHATRWLVHHELPID